MKKKRVLKKWVKKLLSTTAIIVTSFALAFGFMFAMAETHYQRLDYYNELASK